MRGTKKCELGLAYGRFHVALFRPVLPKYVLRQSLVDEANL